MIQDDKAAVLAIAGSQVGVREVGGPNRGPEVEAYIAAGHGNPGDSWCADFVAWCGITAIGASWKLPHVGGCATLANYGRTQGILKATPEVGAVFLLWGDKVGRFHHTGFCVRPNGAGWDTVEGNTNDDGSVNGDGVYAKVRHFAPRDAYLHWWLLNSH